MRNHVGNVRVSSTFVHYHAHLDVFVNGRSEPVAASIGRDDDSFFSRRGQRRSTTLDEVADAVRALRATTRAYVHAVHAALRADPTAQRRLDLAPPADVRRAWLAADTRLWLAGARIENPQLEYAVWQWHELLRERGPSVLVTGRWAEEQAFRRVVEALAAAGRPPRRRRPRRRRPGRG